MIDFTIDQAGLDLITKFEGLKLSPYLDSVNIPTIGIGSITYCDGKKVTMKDPSITKEAAQALLKCYLDTTAMPCLRKVIKVKLNQKQVNSLLSLIYNIGCGGFTKSSVARFINTQQPREMIEDAWRMWNKAGGKVIPGLVNRREAEIKEYFS